MIGQSVTLDGRPYTVVGIMAPDFQFDGRSDVWIPLVFQPYDLANRDRQWLQAVGRIEPDIGITQAQTEMNTIARRLEQQYPAANADRGVHLVSLREYITGDIRPSILVLFGAVGCVLLIACANIANLLLARGATRAREIAVRIALGAGRRRLIRQFLTESILLAALGGLAGILIALWGVDLLQTFRPGALPQPDAIGIDASVLLFTTGPTLLAGLSFGLMPALHASGSPVNESLKTGRTGFNRRIISFRQRDLLVVTEIALALMLVTGAGLLVRSLYLLVMVDPGFNTTQVLTMRLSLPDARYPQSHQKIAFFNDALQRIEALPGVLSVGMVSHAPLTGANLSSTFTIPGNPLPADGNTPSAHFREVSPGYFRTMEIPLLNGRSFTSQDRMGMPGTVIINRTMARRFWAEDNPVGQQLTVDMDGSTREIVGVVGDIRHIGLHDDPAPEMYVPYLQSPWPSMAVVVRSAAEPAALAPSIRRAVAAVDRDLPIDRVRTMNAILTDATADRRFMLFILGFFAAAALILVALLHNYVYYMADAEDTYNRIED